MVNKEARSTHRDAHRDRDLHSSTVEQYVKIIYVQASLSTNKMVPMGAVVQAMKVAPSTATAMVKFLDQQRLAHYVPRTGVTLTKSGERLALQVVRRHRLVETFLQMVLGYDWSEVHEDAERLEHAVSDTFIDRLDAFLNYPHFDPHGAPIPSTTGTIRERSLIPLHRCEREMHICIARIDSHERSLLQSLQRYNLLPGRYGVVRENNELLSLVEVEIQDGDAPVSLGYTSARHILVQKEGS